MTPIRILVVEDERIIAKGIEKRLKGLGYTVAGLVGTGEEAVQQAVALKPDLVLMDINLGTGIDGIDAATRLRDKIDVPVVFLTAHSDDATLKRAKLTGPFGYVLKPYEDNDLLIAIEIGLHKHKMERAIRDNERWLAATLGSIGDGVVATDGEGRVRFMNPLAEQLTGWARAEALGRDVRDVFNVVEERTRQPVKNPAIGALEGGAPTSTAPKAILVARDGAERPIDDSAAPIRDANGATSGAVLVFRDISERRRLEEHLRQAQKLEAIGRLAGGIAHDFNNIMTIITGFSELLGTHADLTPQHREFVNNIRDAGKRAAALTQQITAFGRKQVLVPCALSLNSIVRDMGAVVRRQIGTNIEFVTETCHELGLVMADPTQLGQVVLNLAANARDAMPTGGRFVITTANAELGEELAERFPDVKPGPYVLLSVADTGCGIHPDVLPSVFEPFFTTKEVGKGTGLGLATIHGIVKQSGGHVEVSSELGVGTTFRIYLPRIPATEPEPVSREVPATARGSETILLVEDEDTVRRMTRLILEREGYTVLEANHGEAALAVAKRHDGVIDLLMTDLTMPHLSGRELADRFATDKRVQRVLFVSASTEEGGVPPGTELAAVGFLPKPFDIATALSTVRDLLDQPVR